ncbi:MAG: hypothetical protein CMJ78_02720 [Planctomycetaceae bacterium]|nr:hypothetical protein [Planctomycetaceae bacterium]
MRSFVVVMTLCLFVLTGCGAQMSVETSLPHDSPPEVSVAAADFGGNEKAGNSKPEPTDKNANTADASKRRIIYRADLTLVVNDFEATERDLPKLISDMGGYVSETSIGRNRGVSRQATWVARVPVPKYERFLEDLTDLGVAQNFHQKADDVTSQFVDLEARIANKKQLEARIVELLKNHSGKINDLLEIERELARIREEIERMQGQLRLLDNQSSLATVSIAVREEQDYVPPQEPTFTTQIASTFASSIDNIVNCVQACLLFLTAASPWLVLLTIMFMIARKLITKRKVKASVATS